jgi:hypothetical protein
MPDKQWRSACHSETTHLIPISSTSDTRLLGHQISHTVVGELLKKQKFSPQANRSTMFYSTNQKSSVAIVIGKPIPKPDRFLSGDNQF